MPSVRHFTVDEASLGRVAPSDPLQEGLSVHALRRFIDEQLEVNGWTQADLVRQSGLSKQHLSKLLADDREELPRLPTKATLTGLAQGLRVPLTVVVLRAAQACGVPVDVRQVEVGSPRALSTDQLLGEIRRRIELGGAGDGRDAAPIGPADGPDNVTELRTEGTQRSAARRARRDRSEADVTPGEAEVSQDPGGGDPV